MLILSNLKDQPKDVELGLDAVGLGKQTRNANDPLDNLPISFAGDVLRVRVEERDLRIIVLMPRQ
jgi:hypothetical protein